MKLENFQPLRWVKRLAPCMALTGLLGLGLQATSPAYAATEAERVQAMEQLLKNSQAALERLQARVAELEKRPAAAVVAPLVTPVVAPVVVSAPATEQRFQTVERALSDITSSMAQAKPADTGVPLHGFLDVNWERRSKSTDASAGRNGHKVGVLDFYLTPKFGDHVRTLIELAFEYGADGGLATDAERVQIGYAFGDALVVWAGRFHTPYGYWNTAFHHGAQIQTAITRPRFLGFEDAGGLLPSHSVGLWATGKRKTPLGRVSYDVWASNGNRISGGVLDFNASGDDNGGPGLGFNLGIDLSAVPGLTLGVHGMRQTVGGENSDGSQTGKGRMNFFGGYAFFENDSVEVISEYYGFRNRDLMTPGSNKLDSWAGYAQLGYNLAPRWVAFVRAEKSALAKADPYFSLQDSGKSYQTTSVGLRYDLDPRASIKLQLDRSREQEGNKASWLRAQLAVRF
jgi:hypothetical protein